MEGIGAELEYWISLVIRRHATISRVAAVVMGVTVALTLVRPPVYESKAKVLVQDSRAQLLVSPGIQGNSSSQPSAVNNPITEQDLNSERDLLVSTYLVAQALAGLELPKPEGKLSLIVDRAFHALLSLPTIGYQTVHRSPVLSEEAQQIASISRHLSSWVIRRSNIIEVSFTANDPKWAQTFLSRLIDQYLEYHARLSNDPQAMRFFETQAQMLKERLQKSEESLQALQLRTGITDLPEQRRKLTEELAALEDDYNDTAAELAAAISEMELLKEQSRRTPQVLTKETRQEQNLALQQIKPEVLRLEAERAELLSRYQPTSARIRQIDAKLNAAKAILAHESDLEIKESSTALNPVWVAIDTSLKQTQAKVASLKARQEALQQQIKVMHERLANLITNSVEIERAQRQVETDRELYLSYIRKSEEARASHGLNQSKIFNVSVAQPPTVPLKPISPNIPLNLSVGLILALGLGVGAAYWEECSDPKVYSLIRTTKRIGLAGIGIIPEED